MITRDYICTTSLLETTVELLLEVKIMKIILFYIKYFLSAILYNILSLFDLIRVLRMDVKNYPPPSLHLIGSY